MNINDFANGDFLKVYAVTSAGCTTTLVQQALSKVSAPSFFIETDKAGNAVCSGELITITASTTSALVGTTTYTYYIGGALVAQTNTASISTNSITVDTLVRIEVQSSSGCTSTRSLTVLVPQLASTGSITLSDASDVLICKGGDPSVINGDNSGSSRVASVTNGSISYQWFYKTDSMADYLETGTGAAHTGENYDPGTLNQTTTFVRRAYARIGSSTCDDANSNPITIQVDNERTPLIKRGGIPITSLSVCDEEVTTFTADGFVGTDSFTWFINASLVATQTVNYQVASGTFNIFPYVMAYKKNKISKNWVNKQRRDIYVRQSKVDGYRARSAYKLIEIDEKFKIFKGGLSVICLLYTSPSPRDRQKSRMPSSA